MNHTPATGPLAGLKVIEICTTIAGPACARLLADFGADVIKVEPPQGDTFRKTGETFLGDDAAYFLTMNRNKRSVVLDLNSDEGKRVAETLMMAYNKQVP